ncbi:hypothetical protein C1645_879410 [Glomus cerebriforme]|uniref:Glutamyl-tRNA amidotransferase complex subunit Gta3 domain-containing protein n=1 Tax=Glomus cerebriforme TaxID=658196 RepID=A0A397SRJ8_9GLOM|nr:hypothetical protein C1645_879410 [Glomus cerebriforme]
MWIFRKFIIRNNIKSLKRNHLKRLLRYSNNYSTKTDEYGVPENPTWSVRSLLPPFTDSKPIITKEEYKTLLKLSNLRSTSSLEDSKLIQDINLLCYFVKHIHNVDVTNIEPMRSVLADGVNLNLCYEEEKNENIKSENQGRDLLKRASVLHKEFYVVKIDSNDNN